jgi:hypothetical protein
MILNFLRRTIRSRSKALPKVGNLRIKREDRRDFSPRRSCIYPNLSDNSRRVICVDRRQDAIDRRMEKSKIAS